MLVVTIERFRVHQGDTFEVALREPPATGHRWRLVSGAPAIAIVDDRYESPGARGPLGSVGRRIITLRADRQGRHRLEFVLARRSENRRQAEHHVEVEAY